MINRFCRIVALALILSTPVLSLELDSTYLADIRRGMDYSFNEQFNSARTIFKRMIEIDSTDHAAYAFLAGVYHAEMIDAEDYNNKPVFFDLIDKAIHFAEIAVERGIKPEWAYLTMGNAHAYTAAFEGKEGSWFQAVKRGVKAKNNYLRALERDPLLYDSYVGLGTYHYWKSAKTEFVNWLPLVADRKQQGIDELYLAKDSALFTTDIATNSLIWIYVKSGRAQLAIPLAQELHDKHPESRMALWGLAFSNYSAGRFRDALKCFGQLIQSIEVSPDQNYFNLIECRYHRARMFQTLRENDKVSSELETLLGYPIPAETAQRQKEKLKSAREMMRSLTSD